MRRITYLDRPPSGWFVLDVLRKTARRWDWVALIVDALPDPDDPRKTGEHSGWVRIPGKHRTRENAWDALEDLLKTRH